MHLNKIKVNHMSDGYWLIPSWNKIFTPKSSKYATKFCKTFEELISYNDFLNKNVVLSLNGDHNFYHFNKVMKMLNFDFQILENQIKNLDIKDVLIFKPIENLNIIFDYKAIKLIYSGIIPIFNLNYYEKLYKEYNENNQDKIVNLVFRRLDFKIWK